LKKILYPKFLFPTLKLIFTVSFLVLFCLVIVILFDKSKNKDFGFWLSAIFFLLFLGYFSFHLAYFFCFYFKIVTIEHKTLSIFELNKLKSTKLNYDDILGYSKSEVFYGKYTWKSKSIIIYSRFGYVSEIQSSFTFGVNEIEKELKNRKVKYLGFEHYDTGLFFRKYKFLKK
jgi:hypothetical protein